MSSSSSAPPSTGVSSGRARPTGNRVRRRMLLALLGVALAGFAVFRLTRPSAPPWREEVEAERMADLAALAGRVTRDEVTRALAIVDPLRQLRDRYELTDDAIIVRDEGVDLRIALAPRPVARPAMPRRFLLDPGHHGG